MQSKWARLMNGQSPDQHGQVLNPINLDVQLQNQPQTTKNSSLNAQRLYGPRPVTQGNQAGSNIQDVAMRVKKYKISQRFQNQQQYQSTRQKTQS